MNENYPDDQFKNDQQNNYDQTVPEAAPAVFSTGIIEKIMSIAVFPICFIYSYLFINDIDTGYINEAAPEYMMKLINTRNTMFGIFVILFLVMGEIFYWKRKRSWESTAMMIFVILGAVSVCFSVGSVWDTGVKIFFTHLFGVYWVLCRSGRLAKGETSNLLPWDGITGFFVMPCKNWPLNVRTIITIFRDKKKRKANVTTLIVILASIVGIILFLIAMSFLRNADAGFNSAMTAISDIFIFDIDFDIIPRLFITVFFATWMYGLFGGCYRETEAQVRNRGDLVMGFIEKLRKVPDLVWIIFIGLFSVFYILFFVIQGKYLFNAFIMKLPQEFTYSQYARQGFGDMCKVVVVNFILLWLATRTSVSNSKASKTACAVLTLESMLFALIGFLKIAMYINAYGFTPLRFQSIWAATVLFFACICFMINMLSGKKTMRIWFYVSAASLAVLCMV